MPKLKGSRGLAPAGVWGQRPQDVTSRNVEFPCLKSSDRLLWSSQNFFHLLSENIWQHFLNFTECERRGCVANVAESSGLSWHLCSPLTKTALKTPLFNFRKCSQTQHLLAIFFGTDGAEKTILHNMRIFATVIRKILNLRTFAAYQICKCVVLDMQWKPNHLSLEVPERGLHCPLLEYCIFVNDLIR